jgi:hypothetical protein
MPNGSIGLVGIISILIGVALLAAEKNQRGEMEVEVGKFKGPVWFILIAFGLVLLFIGSV